MSNIFVNCSFSQSTLKSYTVKSVFSLNDRFSRGLLFFIILLLPLVTLAQSNTFTGVVKFDTEEPVAYATVNLNNGAMYSETNEHGVFEFEKLAYGKHTIEVKSIEAADFKLAVDFNDSSKKYLFTVKKSKAFNLDEMLISVKTEKRELETKGFAANVIEMKEASLLSMQTAEILDRTAGVRIRQDGGLGSRINFNLNGLSGEAVRIFIDGVPASNYGASFSISSIPPALIDRVEVYKGVVPAYLSDDALGGAVNIILKKRSRSSLVTSYSGGSFNTHQWNIAGNYRLENGLTTEASAFVNYSDNSYKVWGENIAFKDHRGNVYPNQKAKRFNDTYKSKGVKVEVGYTGVKWADRFMIGGIISRDYKEIQHGITMDLVYGDRHTRGSSNVMTLSYSKKDFLIEGLSVKVDGSYSHVDRQAIDTIGRMYDWSGKPLRNPNGSYVMYTTGAEVGSAKTLGINKDKISMIRSIIGYDINENNKVYATYMHNKFIRDNTDELQPLGLQILTNTKDLQKSIFAFTYENIAFNNRLRTNIFYKNYHQKVLSNEPYRKEVVAGQAVYDINVFTENVTFSGYGLTLSYQLFNDFYLMGSGEKAIRLPNANEIFGDVNNNLLPGGSSLVPEESNNLNIGFNWSGIKYKGHQLRLGLTYFYRDTKGMIREAINGGSFTFSKYENLDNVLSRGFDIEAVYEYADKFNLSINVSKFDVLFNTRYDKYGSPYLYYRQQIRNEPSFKFNVNAIYYINDLFAKKSRASVYYNLNYVNEFKRNWSNVGKDNLDIIPEQVVSNLGLSYTLPSGQWTFSVDAKNVFNKQVFDNFGLQKPGRGFFGKVTYSLISK